MIDVGLPLIGLVAYIFVYRAIHAPEIFVGFVILGGAMSAFWLNVLWTMSNQFFWERQTGNLALYIMAPSSLMAILLGMAVGGIVIATLRAAAIIVLGSWLFHVQYAVASVPMVILVFLSHAHGALRHGYDVRFAVPAVRPRGLAFRRTVAGAGLSAVWDVLPD